MILYGPNIKTQSSHWSKPQAVLTPVTQVQLLHAVEMIAPTLSGTMKKEKHLGVLVDAMFELGLSTLLNNNLCHQVEIEKLMCPGKNSSSMWQSITILVPPLPRTPSMELVYPYSSTPDAKHVDRLHHLFVLDTRDVADPSVVDAVRNLKKTGQEQ